MVKTDPRVDKDGKLLKALSLETCRFPRAVIEVRFDTLLNAWVAFLGDYPIAANESKTSLLQILKKSRKRLWEFYGVPSQINVKNKDTQQYAKKDEATYGYDPRDSKG